MFDPFSGFQTLGPSSAPRELADQMQSRRKSPDVQLLEDQVDKLTLICMAMWSLMQDKTGVTEEQLLERVRTLDMMDGVADGKARKGICTCPQCNRTMSPRHQRCLYCGHAALIKSAFDTL